MDNTLLSVLSLILFILIYILLRFLVSWIFHRLITNAEKKEVEFGSSLLKLKKNWLLYLWPRVRKPLISRIDLILDTELRRIGLDLDQIAREAEEYHQNVNGLTTSEGDDDW